MGLILIILGLLVAAGIGVLFLKNFVRNPDELMLNARNALHAGDYEAAADQAREQLKLTPGRPDARAVLFEALVKLGEFEEARVMAEERYERNRDDVMAFGVLCGIALEKRDFSYVSKLAREAASELPGPAFHVLAVTHDYVGLMADDWRVRMQAASMMRDGAYLAKSPAERARALWFSAAVSTELLPFIPNPATVKERIQADVRNALAALSQASDDESNAFRAMLGLFSEEEDVVAQSVQSLMRFTSGEQRLIEAVAALATHHMSRGEVTDAMNFTRDLHGDYHWYRALWVARHTGRRDIALEMIDNVTGQHPWLRNMRAVLQLESDDAAEREAGCAALEDLVKTTEMRLEDAITTALQLARHAGAARALTSARGTRFAGRSSRFAVLTAYLESLVAGEASQAREFAAQLIAQAGSLFESWQIHRALDPKYAPESATLTYSASRALGQGSPASLIARSVRLLSVDRKEAVLEVKMQLETVLRELSSSRRVLAQGFDVATSIGEWELAAGFLGRALALEGPPRGFELYVIGIAWAVAPEKVAALSRALDESAPQTTTPAFVTAFARALMHRGANIGPVLDALETAALEPASWLPSLVLAGKLAMRAKDPFRADRAARAVLEKRPAHAAAQELLAASLMYRHSYREVVELFSRVPPSSERAYEQFVRAHLMLKQRDAALEQAEAATRKFPGSAAPYLTLAKVHASGGEHRRALLALNWAPRTADVQLTRASLLEELGDVELARSVYETILMSTENTHIGAWFGMKRLMVESNRAAGFMEYSATILDAGLPRSVEIMVRGLRGDIVTEQGDLVRALPEWVRIIELDPRNAPALNNAAWNLAITKSKRTAEALDYINRALAVDPNSAPYLDTAAQVHAVIGSYGRALQYIENALALRPKEADQYRVHKARILLDAGMRAEALRLVRELAANSTLASARSDAQSILDKLLAEDRVTAEEKAKAEEDKASGQLEDSAVPGKR